MIHRPRPSRFHFLLRLPVCLGWIAGVAGIGGVAGCAGSPGFSPPGQPQTAEERLQALSFLSGDWIGPSPKGLWEAHYTLPDGGMMLSTNKEYIEGRGVTAYEFEKFLVQEGEVVVWPYPMGRRTVAFALTALDVADRRAVFENHEHDFPQRIEYWRRDAKTLEIYVSAPKPEDPDKQHGFKLQLFAMAPGGRPHPRYMRNTAR